eukprot:8573054-Karenia_brevis.AAC.1
MMPAVWTAQNKKAGKPPTISASETWARKEPLKRGLGDTTALREAGESGNKAKGSSQGPHQKKTYQRSLLSGAHQY